MILPFSTIINKKPTYFVEKIHSGLLQNNLLQGFDLGYDHKFDIDKLVTSEPKIHTIREDKNERWKKGNKIDFFINCRQKNMFRFAPVLPVVSVQEIFMTKRGCDLEITIAKIGPYMGGDDTYLYAAAKNELAINDGFDTYEDFRDYFFESIESNYKLTGNNWFSAKLIHWTDKIY